MDKSVLERISKCMENEDIQDTPFRATILISQLADLMKYITHDPKINPTARPFSGDDETVAFGHAIIQLFGLAHLRAIDISTGINTALDNWESHDWKRKESKEVNKIKGTIAVKGIHVGRAIILHKSKDKLNEIQKGDIIVSSFLNPEIAIVANLLGGIVTDHGGKACHAAIIANEYEIPCVVGTGNATKLIKDGQIVTLDANNGEVLFK